MRRIGLRIIFATLLIASLPAAAANAASPHFKHGGEPTCTISGTGTNSVSTTCTGTLAGLGGGDLLINTTVLGAAVYQCQNNGGNVAPGQNTVLVGPVTEPTNISGSAIKNGNLTFTTDAAVLTAPATVTGQQAGCPNANWTGVNPSLKLTSILMEIQQPVGTTIFTCTASSSNGLSGTVTLTC